MLNDIVASHARPLIPTAAAAVVRPSWRRLHSGCGGGGEDRSQVGEARDGSSSSTVSPNNKKENSTVSA